jgi:hypothetical protein
MTKEEADANSKILLTIAIIVGGFIALSYIGGGINSFLESLGLKADKEEKKLNEDLEKAEEKTKTKQPVESEWKPENFNPYQPNLSINNLNKYVQRNSTRLKVNSYPSGYFKANAKKVYDSVGYVYDSPEKGLAAIKYFTTKLGISYLAADFQKEYDKDMFEFLKNKYDTDEQKEILNKIYNYINSLPVGIRDKKNNSIIM